MNLSDIDWMGAIERYGAPSHADSISALFSARNVNEAVTAASMLEQLPAPVWSDFCQGVYLRKITMPVGVTIGAVHKTEHFNIILRGRVRVMIDGETFKEYTAGAIFKSGIGAQKVLNVIEECEWVTIHATPETDEDKIESMLIEPHPLREERKLLFPESRKLP